jgi:nitric oxide reductase subunit C
MPGTRVFFVVCLTAALLLAIIVPLAGGAFSLRAVPDDVAQGYRVWQAFACAGCHTLNGQGSAYAPDLTKIFSARGANYLREFLVNPGAFHPNAIRIMPRLGLTIPETDHLLAFLQWVDENAGAFPPRPINVSGGLPESLADSVSASSAVPDVPSDPVAAGRFWFSRPPANCATCHSLEPDVVIVGPSLAGVATRAASRVSGMSAAAYLRDSILDPSAFVVPGFPDAMARNLGEVLDDQQINNILAFLETLE